MIKKIILFDCDGTLWSSKGRDFISSVDSSLQKINFQTLLRQEDGKKFLLKDSVIETFILLKKKNFVLGIVSDNKPKQIISALRLFGLWKYINPKAFKVKLWNGYCPKHKMILEILNKKEFRDVPKNMVFWVDDKDYSKEAREININFIKINPKGSLFEIIKQSE